ncbi:MAG TPA: ABC transporter ATP-binding protein, partial [Polyangiaceae bacterium]|nr:ABC transporter ATP-binding protein [Polyangiaceae bacterium]
IAVLLLGRAEGRAALLTVSSSLAVSVLRSAVMSSATHAVRRGLFARLGTALSRCPAVLAHELTVNQIDTEIARGVPWIELLVASALPSLIGNVLALPLIAYGAWRYVGAGLTLVGGAALTVAVVIGIMVARSASGIAERAWASYQIPARLVEAGLRGRTELQAHGLGDRQRTLLMEAVDRWSVLERYGYLLRAVTGWIVPILVVLVLALTAPLAGFTLDELVELSAQGSRQIVFAGLLGATAIPVLWGLSRGFADVSAALPYWRALQSFEREALAGEPTRSGPFLAKRIELNDVSFSYAAPGEAGRSGQRDVVSSANLVWSEGESLAMVGPNGSGKTTLALLLLGLTKPDAGVVRATDESGAVVEHAVAGAISYLAQRNYFDELETVRKAIDFVAPGASDAEAAALVLALQGPVYDPKILEKPARELSAGQLRVVALARVLLRRSPLTILDEPEANLDVNARSRLLDVLKGEIGRRHFLIITHDDAFSALADRVVSLVDGQLVERGRDVDATGNDRRRVVQP